MGDAEHRTTVPLLNGYKHGLATRRLLQTVTGGLKLQKAPCYIHLLRLSIYLSPLVFAIPFIIVDSVGVWNEYYLAFVYAFIYTLTVFALRISVYCAMKCTHAEGDNYPQSDRQFNNDNTIEGTSCCSYSTLFFIFHSKSIVSLFLHSLVVCGLLSFTSSFILLPRVLTEHLPLPGAVVVCITGWLVTCGAHYSLNVNQPHETAVYRPTDLLGLEPLMRPVYLIFCATAIIAVRLAVTCVADVYLELLYAAVCVLPLCWMCGVLPPLDALQPWAMEQILTRLMGGSHMATDVRLLVVFLLSVFSTLTVAVTGQYSSSTATLLLATTTGYLLSQDLFLITNILMNYSRRKSSVGFEANRSIRVRQKSFFRHILVSSVRGCLLLIVSVLLVYFSSTAKDTAKRVAGRVAGSCTVALTLFLWTSGTCQGIYVLGLFRNPLHPWRSEDVQKYKSWRKKLSFCSMLRTLVLTYVSPLLMLVFVTLAVDSDTPNKWLSAVGIARIFRKIWQNTWGAQSELFVVSLLLLILPGSSSAWMNLGVGLQALLVGMGLDVCGDLWLKLRFVFTLFLKFIVKDRKRIRCWLYILIIVGSLLFLPLPLVTVLLSSIISAPLLPLFTLPVFLISFPRTRRFWPSLFNYGSSYHNCRDSVYYQQDVPELSRALQGVFSAASAQPGDYFLFRYQDRILIVTVLESGHSFHTLNISGLEMQETSCHTVEAARIDDIFSDTYDPKSLRSPSFWFNCHPLNALQPVDSAVIRTYSDARSVLTGIIDQPPVLKRFSDNLLKCIVWVLYQYMQKLQGEEGRGTEGRRAQQEGCGAKGVNWRWRNKVIPVVDSEFFHRTSEIIDSQSHTQDHTELLSSPEPHVSAVNKAVSSVPKEEDSLSWTSIESVEDTPTSIDHCDPQYVHTMSELIPVDIPLDTEPSITQVQSSSQWIPIPATGATRISKSGPLQSLKLVFPEQWLEFPLLDRQIDILLHSFPSDWLTYLCDSNTGKLPLSLEEMLVFKKLCLTCFSIVDVPHCSLGAVETRPFHIHSGFHGDFPYSTDREWLTGKQDLFTLTLRAYRYAVKLLCDETVLGDAGDCAELSDYLQTYHSEYHIGSEGEPEWNHAVLDHTPHLFSIGKSQDSDTYTVHLLTLQDQLVHVGKLNSAAVHAVWSDLSLELLYLTNDDEERYSIQAHPSLLRNLTIQAADPPLGYTVYSSGIIRCPCVM